MAKKQLIAGATGVAVVGILSYLGYCVFKELNDLDLNDFIGENLSDEYYQSATGFPSQKSNERS